MAKARMCVISKYRQEHVLRPHSSHLVAGKNLSETLELGYDLSLPDKKVGSLYYHYKGN